MSTTHSSGPGSMTSRAKRMTTEERLKFLQHNCQESEIQSILNTQNIVQNGAIMSLEDADFDRKG
jgi:hypothetical protein